MTEEVQVRDKGVWLAGAAFIALCLTVVLNVLSLVLLTHQARYAAQNRKGICSYYSALITQRDASQRLVEKHPEILKQFHITPRVYSRSIQQQTQQIESLRPLHCSGPTPQGETNGSK